MKKKKLIIKKLIKSFLVVMIVGAIKNTSAQTIIQNAPDTIPLKYGAHRTGNRNDAAMERWRNYGLGQFIHWGVYAIPGGHWQGKIYSGAAEWIRSWSGDTAPDNWKNTYDNLYKQFNPTDFDATKWAKQAKQMGAKYMIFTTKHHDGFSLWPSKFTDYNIANTPYKKDIVKQVVDAYDKEGIDVYLYFSIIDWNHPGYRSSIPKTEKEIAAYEEFKQFTKNQLLELLQNYPSTKGLWFDGSWDQAWIKEAKFTDDLERELRKVHPDLIIGSRFRADDNGKRHFDSNGKMMGDYEQGWERKLPANIDVVEGRDWDCVMTIPPNQWGYNSDWRTSYIKTAYDLSQMLMHAVSLNGNLVINFGPDGKGNIRPEEGKIASELGHWVDGAKQAIYGVRYADLPKPEYGFYSKKNDQLFLTVFNPPTNRVLRLAIPRNHQEKPAKVTLDGERLNLIEINMGLDRDQNLYYDIMLPIHYKITKPFVIAIDMQQSKKQKNSYGDSKT